MLELLLQRPILRQGFLGLMWVCHCSFQFGEAGLQDAQLGKWAQALFPQRVIGVEVSLLRQITDG